MSVVLAPRRLSSGIGVRQVVLDRRVLLCLLAHVLVGRGLLAPDHLLIGVVGFIGLVDLVEIERHGGLGPHLVGSERGVEHFFDLVREPELHRLAKLVLGGGERARADRCAGAR